MQSYSTEELCSLLFLKKGKKPNVWFLEPILIIKFCKFVCVHYDIASLDFVVPNCKY